MKDSDYAEGLGPPLGHYRWRVEPGAWLLSEPPAVHPSRRLRVVALGGGTGLPVVLQGLKAGLFRSAAVWNPHADSERLSAIVTVADDGGSSGRLRREHGVLPPGDIRNCLLALSDGNPLIARLFDFRFDGPGETAGHSLGNLILTALSRIGKGFDQAVERGGNLLTIRGQVLPSSLDSIVLRAEFCDGTWIEGESKLRSARRPIRRIHTDPEDARPLPPAP